MKILLWFNYFYASLRFNFFASLGGAALIGGGASLLGGLMSNKSSAKQADRSMEFQKEVAQHGHQWQVADMRSAGLNPILSATGGSGAKASGGAMATQQDVITPAVQSALAVRRQSEDLKLLQAQTAKTKEDEYLAKQMSATEAFKQNHLAMDQALKYSQSRTELQRAVTEQALQSYYRDQGNAAKSMAAKTTQDTRSSKVEADINEEFRAFERAISAGAGGSSAARNVMQLFRALKK